MRIYISYPIQGARVQLKQLDLPESAVKQSSPCKVQRLPSKNDQRSENASENVLRMPQMHIKYIFAYHICMSTHAYVRFNALIFAY